MRTQVEIKLARVAYAVVNNCTRWNISALISPVLDVAAKQPGVVSSLNRYERDAGSVADFSDGAGASDGP